MREKALKIKKRIEHRVPLNPKKFYLELRLSLALQFVLSVLFAFQLYNFNATERQVFNKLENQDEQLDYIYYAAQDFRRSLIYMQDYVINQNSEESRRVKLTKVNRHIEASSSNLSQFLSNINIFQGSPYFEDIKLTLNNGLCSNANISSLNTDIFNEIEGSTGEILQEEPEDSSDNYGKLNIHNKKLIS